MLCATGMIKGILMLLSFFHIMDAAGGTYTILYNAADALFYFLPVLIGYTTAKKFGMNEITGLMLGLVMCAPTLVNLAPNAIAVAFGSAPKPLGTLFGMNYYATLFGIPVIMPASGNYTSTVVPIILVIWFASFLERKIKAVIPTVIKNFGVPLFVFIITVPLMFIVIGPVAAMLTEVIEKGVIFVFSRAAVFGGFLFGGLWQILVIFGLHWSLIPLMFINLANLKYDMILSPMFAASFAQLAALIAVMLKTKDKQTKSIGIPAVISAIAGVTEPAIYGITLPRKIPFIYSCIGAAVGGAILAAAKVYSYISAGLGVFGFPEFIMTEEYSKMYNVPISMHGVVWASIAVLVSMAVSFLLVMFFYKEPESGSFTKSRDARTHDSGKKAKPITVVSPLKGKIIDLDKIEDEAFSSGALGKGCAILPSSGEVRAPFTGTVSVLPETAHAIGITADSGIDILIHVGMNTVELKGQGFKTYVIEGQKVQEGDLLMTFDIGAITSAGYKTVTPVVINNSDEFKSIAVEKETGCIISVGEPLFSIVPLNF
ncbi:glucose PTS transporter subunit IIA [Treponema brennaborense]|uniref:glucose PTS transporter subunit IIA n=1 Tax=Treponema brennaborense TaxID=81028 RepID=UPI0009FEA680|nr:glucose PTS transporter subunit IIA [Treponema brennaborense]